MVYYRILTIVPCANQFLFLAFNLDYYTEVLDLSYLLDHLASDPFFRHYRQLNEKLVQLIEDYSLVSFIPLNIQVQTHLIVLHFALSCFTDTAFFFFFYKLKVCGNLAWSKSTGINFPTAFVHFLSLCHMLVILGIFQTFFYYYCISYGDL